MTEAIRIYLPWLLSAITIWTNLLAGNLNRNTWLIGMVNQVLWLIWIIATRSWGFIPLNIALKSLRESQAPSGLTLRRASRLHDGTSPSYS
jgi:hypothetical protein